MWLLLKKLLNKLLPFHEVIQIKDEILESKKGNDLKTLEHLLLYLEFQIDSRNDYQMDYLLRELFNIKQNMASDTMNRGQLDIAEGHCQQCLTYSRRYGLKGEQKTTDILVALRTYCNLRELQRNYSGALKFAEEAYNLVVEAYGSIHPQVQAAELLIDILIMKSDLFDYERYAQVTYDNLRDKKNGIDQEGEEMATGA
jgi:hypothetical protein